MTPENQDNGTKRKGFWKGTADKQHVIAGFRGNEHERNNKGTVGNSVFNWVRAEAI
jgi:hypothetical protein